MKLQDLKKVIATHNIAKNQKLTKGDLDRLLESITIYKSNIKNYNYWEYKFGDNIIKVNQEQYNIITCDKKDNIRVIAAAGSGKTTTILCRIKYLIDHDVNPSRIILCAFNVEAAKSMKNKIIELFGFMPKIIIGTIDSIACKFYNAYFKKNYYVSVSEYSPELLKYLKSSDGYNILNSYDYFFFDEFQDSNLTQYNILKAFYENGTKVVVIGDDSQNIYQFRGSNVQYIIDFDKYINNLKTFKLLHNYRSTPEIVNIANISISNNKNQIKKDMIATRKTLYIKPQVKHYISFQLELADIINKILIYKQTHSLDQIAIISRNISFLKNAEEKIEKHNNCCIISNKINYISLLSDQNNIVSKKDHIVLTTIHKSKGLEWNIVFLVGCDDMNFPSSKDVSIEEERRLFYVAITRAKTYLHISFRNKNNKVIPVSRFIQEIPRSFYEFENYDSIFYNLTTYNKVIKEESISKIIRTLNDIEITYLRDNNLIPKLDIIPVKHHEPITIDQRIIDNHWFADFSEYIKTHIKRNSSYIDINAVNVIYTCLVSDENYTIFNNYIKNKNSDNLDIVHEIQESIKGISIKHGISIDDVIVTNNKFLSNKMNNKFEASYKRYCDPDAKDIDEDIYNVSQCTAIYNGRKRLIYNSDVAKIFTDNIKGFEPIVYENIKHTGLIIKNKKYSLTCEINLVLEEKLVLIKCSNDDNFKLEWLLEIMGCYYLYDQDSIKELQIYNPIRGITYSITITDIILDSAAFLKFLCIVRNKQKMLPCEKLQTLEECSDLSKLLDDNKWLALRYLDTYKKNISTALMKDLYEQMFLEYYNAYKKVAKSPYVIYKITKTFKFNYLVFDTETNGLPHMINYQQFPQYYDLDKYKTARLIQLSWAIYDSADILIKIQNYYIKPKNFGILNSHIHGITYNDAITKGHDVSIILKKFIDDLAKVDYVICHNTAFDVNIIKSELFRLNKENPDIKIFDIKKTICTLAQATKMKKDGIIKNAKLGTVYEYFFNKPITNAHNAEHDVLNTGKVFTKMRKLGIIVM